MGIKERLQQLQEAELLAKQEVLRIATNKAAQDAEEEAERKQKQIEVWNREKGPLLTAAARLEEAGAKHIFEEVASLVAGQIAQVPEVEEIIKFDPKSCDWMSLRMRWNVKHHETEGGYVDPHYDASSFGSVDSWDTWNEAEFSTPMNSDEISLRVYEFDGSFEQNSKIKVTFEKVFLVEEWRDKDYFEGTVAEAFWKAGVKPQVTR